MRIAQGQLAGALAAYEESLDIAREIAKQDPDNAGWARDVSVSLSRIGDARMAQGQLAAALAAYEESLDIRRRLTRQDPDNAGWARDVSVSLSKMAVADKANADKYWAEMIERMEDQDSKGTLLPGDVPILERARRNLATETKQE